jgi:taurine--2-oxoglutarate transaminase
MTASTTLTSDEISAVTRQTNYGTWRFQKTWKPRHVADALVKA